MYCHYYVTNISENLSEIPQKQFPSSLYDVFFDHFCLQSMTIQAVILVLLLTTFWI